MKNRETENKSCQHIKTNGTRCGSPALNNRRYCFFHHRTSDLRRLRLDNPQFRGEFPLLEDANAVQMAIQEVAGAVVQDRIDLRRAGLLLFACQTAASNLKNVNFEPLELRQQDEKGSELTRILFDALEIDLPGMPARQKELTTGAEKESTSRTA
jgi:hypothetical protein